MRTAAGWLGTSGFALIGAGLGLAFAWVNRARPPEEMVLDNGWRVMHPVYVDPTPWWAYAASSVLGVLLALFAVWVVAAVRSTLRPK